MPDTHLPLDALLAQLHILAEDALALWDLPPGARVRLINVSENATFLVEDNRTVHGVLRVHREAYHSRRAIECELAWLSALRADAGIPTPEAIAGRDGQVIQCAATPGLSAPRFLVLFAFVDGGAPDESGDLAPGFEELGALAARCHDHVGQWVKPAPFERLTWDVDAVFGPQPTWGNWRDAPGVDAALRPTLEAVEARVRTRLASYGQGPGRYDLIHADMRLANLIRGGAGTRLIDFDDCGWGWFMYDFAAAISFMEDDPRIPALKAAWLRGYRTRRALDPADEAEIDTFVMLRRMALLAWIGSHIEAPEPQALAPDFAQRTARLGRAWLDAQR